MGTWDPLWRKPRATGARRRLFRSFAMVVAATTLAVAVVLSGPGVASSSGARIYFGVDGTIASVLHPPAMSRHLYRQLDQRVPNARMITLGSNGLRWSQIAATRAGSSPYRNLVRWADALKSRTGPIYLAFGHEPESAPFRAYGNASQYIAAWRHVVNIFRANGVKNVQWTWQMTSYSFWVPRSDRRYAAKWYPGNHYVDDVAADAYDWSACRNVAPVQLGVQDGPALQFARVHDKGAVLGEFATGPGPQRAEWIRNAGHFLAANSGTFRAAYYFDTDAAGGCKWRLTSGADLSALYAIARNATFRH
jgi:Glycosyl hydrolase family 26